MAATVSTLAHRATRTATSVAAAFACVEAHGHQLLVVDLQREGGRHPMRRGGLGGRLRSYARGLEDLGFSVLGGHGEEGHARRRDCMGLAHAVADVASERQTCVIHFGGVVGVLRRNGW